MFEKSRMIGLTALREDQIVLRSAIRRPRRLLTETLSLLCCVPLLRLHFQYAHVHVR